MVLPFKYLSKLSFYGEWYHFIVFPFVLLMLFCLTYFFPYEVVPDYIKLYSNKNIAALFATIISSMASIAGVFVAVLVVAFNYYKSNLKEIYLSHAFENVYILILVVYPITVFLCCTMVLILLPEQAPITSGELTISYIGLILFLLLPFIIFFASYKLVVTLSIDKILDNYVSDLSFDKVFRLTKSHHVVVVRPTGVFDENNAIEKDQLELISKLIISQFKSEKMHGQLVLHEVTKSFSTHLICSIDVEFQNRHNELQYRMSHFLNKLYDRIGDDQRRRELILNTVLSRVQEIYIDLNASHLSLAGLEPFRTDFFKNSLKRSNDQERILIMECLKEIVEECFITKPYDDSFNYGNLDSYEAKEPMYGSLFQTEESESSLHRGYVIRKDFEEIEALVLIIMDEVSLSISKRNESQFRRLLRILVELAFSWRIPESEKNNFLLTDLRTSIFERVIGFCRQSSQSNLIGDIDDLNLVDAGFWSRATYEDLRDNEYFIRDVLVESLNLILWRVSENKASYRVLCGVRPTAWGPYYSTNSLVYLAKVFLVEWDKSELSKYALDEIIVTMEVILANTENTEYRDFIKVAAKEIKSLYFKYSKKRKGSITRKLNKMLKISAES